MSEFDAPSVPSRPRLLVSLALGVLAGLASQFFASTQAKPRDFWVMWSAARALLHGQDPYALVPGVFYPLPGIVAASPFAVVSSAPGASGIFMAVSATAFAWALLEHGWGP